MTSRNLVKLFFSTLMLGGLITGVLGFFIRWSEFSPYFVHGKVISILLSFVWLVGVGFIFSLISQVGYFAYLTIHQFGLGISRSLGRWNTVQIVIVLFTLFDLVYFRYANFNAPGETMISYFEMPLFIFVFGIIIAYMKYKQSNSTSFIPAMFFMTVFTIVELVPVLRVNKSSWIDLMIVPLLICNAYQILILPRYLKRSEEERAAALRRKGINNPFQEQKASNK